MKELGNLAIVCAQRSGILLYVHQSKVRVLIRIGKKVKTLEAEWDDDKAVREFIRELNFGLYSTAEIEKNAHVNEEY